MNQKEQWLFRIFTLGYCLGMLFFAEFFQFMALNVFLAYIPIEISFHLKNKQLTIFVILTLFWLLFYPNAPYLLTDFFHLELLPVYQGFNQVFTLDINGWLYFCLLALGICVYTFLGIASIFSVASQLRERKIIRKNSQYFFFYTIINCLSSLAIYVGRFDRLHSVHLFTRPIQTMSLIFLEWTWTKLTFVLLFTLFQLILLFLVGGMRNATN